MTGKKFVKAFIAGLALPAVFLPLAYTVLYFNYRNPITAHALQFIPMFLPLVWGFANVIFIKYEENCSPRKLNRCLITTGAILGFLVALFGVFVIKAPAAVFGSHMKDYQYLPLLVLPIIYAILWRYVVKYLNKLLAV